MADSTMGEPHNCCQGPGQANRMKMKRAAATMVSWSMEVTMSGHWMTEERRTAQMSTVRVTMSSGHQTTKVRTEQKSHVARMSAT
jgi:hypothetical protein